MSTQIEQIEIERTFLLKNDFNPNNVINFKDCYKLLIVNNYSEKSKVRIRRQKNLETNKHTYYKTFKNFISDGINKEIECEIKHQEYIEFVSDKNTFSIAKTRYTKIYDGYNYCFDVFDYNDLQLCKLEIEKISDDVNLEFDKHNLFNYELPLELNNYIKEEITNNKNYSNYNLAKTLNKIK
jgi:CYTH domain-containing protein